MKTNQIFVSFSIIALLLVFIYNTNWTSIWLLRTKISSTSVVKLIGFLKTEQLKEVQTKETRKNSNATFKIYDSKANNSNTEADIIVENSHPQQEFVKRRKNLIVLSAGRGGSSLLGSLFDNNPHIMYWFEPLSTIMKQIPMERQPAKYKETTSNVIDSFFQCSFDKIDNTILSALSRSIFRKKSKALSKVQLPQFSSQRLSNACKSYDHTVIKILSARVPNTTILTLEKLFQEQNQYDAKLVHLVRDPRGVVYSRVKLGWMKKNFNSPEFRKSVQSVFDPILQNIRLGLFSCPSWLRDRFKVVRYEDLVANMVNVTRDLYNFAGLGWSSNVDKWISTLANNSKHGRTYSLLRNASISMNSWRHAPKPLIEAVEDVCADLMDLLGYEKTIIK